MIRGFKEFLLKNNVLALAVAVIVGGAVGKVVSSLAADILMPLIGMVLPSGEWRAAKLLISKTVGPDGKEAINAINYGTFFGNVVDFAIIAFVVYMMTKALIKEAAPTPPRPRRTARDARKPSRWTPPSASSARPIFSARAQTTVAFGRGGRRHCGGLGTPLFHAAQPHPLA